jgi:hypothetical protein
MIVKSLDEGARQVTPVAPLHGLLTNPPSHEQADVKRVFNIRKGFLLLDFEDDSFQAMKDLSLRCFYHPLYLRTTEGVKFLSFLFGLQPQLIDEIHQTIRSQILCNRKSLMETYGSIYFRAWKEASGQYLLAIEQGCIQNLIQCAVHASTPALFTSIRQVLAEFHKQKRHRGVDEMLLRLYEPILWRALRVANPTVRSQAATLLVDTFPLQDPDATHAEIDALLQKQFDALGQLLMDSAPKVRVVAVHGVCSILSNFWELIPLSTSTALLSRITTELAYDSSSTAVRAAVFNGICDTLEQHLSHATLRQLLPACAPLINDRSDRVRASFVRLLQKVKCVRTIHFLEVVPATKLMQRLRADASVPAVAAPLTELLLNSYFPSGANGSQLLTRCVAFIRNDCAAAQVFYSYVHQFISANSVVKMILLIHKCIVSCVKHDEPEKEKSTGRGKRSQQQVQEAAAASNDKTSDGHVLLASDIPVMTGLLQVRWGFYPSPRTNLNLHCRSWVLSLMGSPLFSRVNRYVIAIIVVVFSFLWLQDVSIQPILDALGGNALPTLMNKFGEHSEARAAIWKLSRFIPPALQPVLAEEVS